MDHNKTHPKSRTFLQRREGKELGELERYSILTNAWAHNCTHYADVYSTRLDGHYLLIMEYKRHSDEYPFGIVEIKNPREASKRLYQKAKELAKEIAGRERNKIIEERV